MSDDIEGKVDDDKSYIKCGNIYYQTEAYNHDQLQNIHIVFNNTDNIPPKLIFTDHYTHKIGGIKQYHYNQQLQEMGNCFGRLYGFGIPIIQRHETKVNETDFEGNIKQKFDTLKNHIINGGDIIIPYPTKKDINLNGHRYLNIYHKIGTMNISVPFKHLVLIQQFLNELEKYANYARTIDRVFYNRGNSNSVISKPYTISSAYSSVEEGKAQWPTSTQKRLNNVNCDNYQIPFATSDSVVIDAGDLFQEQYGCIHSNENIRFCEHFSYLHSSLDWLDDDFVIEMELTQLAEFVNSFHHLLKYHNDNDQFTEIARAYGRCYGDGYRCIQFERYNRKRCTQYEDISDVETLYSIIVRQQLFDKIHCYYCHAFEMPRLYINTKGKEQDPDNEIMNQIMSKFNQLNFINSDDNDNMYCFGREFVYDGTGEHREYDGSLIILAKYQNLKEELLYNDIKNGTLSRDQFGIEYGKANIYWDTDFRKKYHSKLRIKHILSLMVYCNYTALQYALSKTYRESLGCRHSSFYHLGKLLKESVNQFGTRIRDGKQKIFYHGIGQRVSFPHLIGDKGIGVKIYCPLSTSINLSVAANFANNNGFIIEFKSESSAARYFSVSWLSDYPHEMEHLFIQNPYELYVNNVHDTLYSIDYEPVIQSLHIIEQIVSDQYLEIQSINKERIMPVIMRILQFQCKKIKIFSVYEYAEELFDRFFARKTKLKINKITLKINYKCIYDLIFNGDQQCIDLYILDTLFPNVQILELKEINLRTLLVRSILNYFRNNKHTKMQMIVLETKENSDLSPSHVAEVWATDFNEIGFVLEVPIFENNTLIIRRNVFHRDDRLDDNDDDVSAECTNLTDDRVNENDSSQFDDLLKCNSTKNEFEALFKVNRFCEQKMNRIHIASPIRYNLNGDLLHWNHTENELDDLTGNRVDKALDDLVAKPFCEEKANLTLSGNSAKISEPDKDEALVSALRSFDSVRITSDNERDTLHTNSFRPNMTFTPNTFCFGGNISLFAC